MTTALTPEGRAERVESFAEHAAAGSSGLDEAVAVREQEREDAVLGWLAARSLGTHGSADQLRARQPTSVAVYWFGVNETGLVDGYAG